MQQEDIAKLITLVMSNFSLAMLILAFIFILFHKLIKRYLPKGEIVYRWTALFALGFTSIYAFILHAFFPELAASNIGWAMSPFQYEVAIANLAIGALGILSFNASHGFRLATVVGAVVWWWGDAVGHIYRMVQMHDFSTGNAGSWFFTDLIVPLILIIAIRKLGKIAHPR